MAVLEIDLRALEQGALETHAEIAATDPLFSDIDVALVGPVVVDGRLGRLRDDEYLWQATLRGSVVVECRRCLRDVEMVVSGDVAALFTANEEALDDPSAYPLLPRATKLDLTEAVREELVLTVPRFVLCREDCKGLCPQCGADLNTEQCTCTAEA
jgi:uncharacterized protein